MGRFVELSHWCCLAVAFLPGPPFSVFFRIVRVRMFAFDSRVSLVNRWSSRHTVRTIGAPRSGRGGRRFKSCHSDQLIQAHEFLLLFDFEVARQKRRQKPHQEWPVLVATRLATHRRALNSTAVRPTYGEPRVCALLDPPGQGRQDIAARLRQLTRPRRWLRPDARGSTATVSCQLVAATARRRNVSSTERISVRN
jgi:hypothetical protein